MITIGSCFSGIGGFELGLERAIPNSKTIWHCEKDEFCRKILRKHWPDSHIYQDIKHMHTQEVQRPDILCAGFPCQDISVAGKKEGIYGKKSGLFWDLESLICRIRPSIVVLENVPNIVRLGGREVLGALTELGYNAEWTIISARQFGAPHLRKRWFLVAYSNRLRRMEHKRLEKEIQQPFLEGIQQKKSQQPVMPKSAHSSSPYAAHSYSQRLDNLQLRSSTEGSSQTTSTEKSYALEQNSSNAANSISIRAQVQTFRGYSGQQMSRSNGEKRRFWEEGETPSPLCGVDDGIPKRVDRIRALGNAIVPQCSEYIGHCIVRSGLLDELIR